MGKPIPCIVPIPLITLPALVISRLVTGIGSWIAQPGNIAKPPGTTSGGRAASHLRTAAAVGWRVF